MNKEDLTDRDIAELKNLHNNHKWGIRELSEQYEMEMEDILEVLGEAPAPKIKPSPKQPIKVVTTKIPDEESIKTIKDHQEHGCSIARCPKCGAVMNGAVQDNYGAYHYCCERCGYNDLNDTVCNNKCCRRGLIVILNNDPDAEISVADATRYINEGAT